PHPPQPASRAWTTPPAGYAARRAARSRRTSSVATASRSAIAVREEHLHRPRSSLLRAGEERPAVVVEREAVRDDGRHVDPAARHQVEVDLHRMPPPALELLDAEGIGTDDLDLLEVERRPLEALRAFDTGHDDRSAGCGDADGNLDRLGEANGVVDDADTAAVQPGRAVPRPHQLGPRLGGDALDQGHERLVRQDERGTEALGERLLVREAGDGEHARRGRERA